MPAPVIYAITPNKVKAAGSGSSAIQIVGAYLDPASATLTFAGSAATPLEAISGFFVQGGAPAHAAGAVNVVVTTGGGTATATGGLTYI